MLKKDICWYTNIVCHCIGITWETEVQDRALLFIFSVALTFLEVVVLIVLSVLTIYKLKKDDPDRVLVRQNVQVGTNTKIEHKLVVIGVINSILAVTSEVSCWVVLFISLASYKPHSCPSHDAWCLFILNNVLNIPVYLIILKGNCCSA